MTPEQIKHREFPIRLKGYDPDEVRRFLDQVAAVFRVAVADEGGRAASGEDDLSQVLAAAHEAAEKIVADAERQAATLVAKAEDKHARADEHAARAKHILERAQDRSAEINADCRAAQQMLVDAQAQADQIVANARENASKVALTERATEVASQIEAQVEVETRARLDEVDAAADAKLAELDTYVADSRRAAEAEADRLLSDARARVEELTERERILQARVAEAQAELRSIVARFVGESPMIDLTAADPVVAFEGSYREGLDDEFLDDELFPELEDDAPTPSDVHLEWNKPEWARPSKAIPVSR